MEVWKDIPSFDGKYQASTLGNIKTFNWKNSGREAIMKPAKDANGYLRTMLNVSYRKNKTVKVHRVIAKTFIPNPENKLEVNHKNGIKSDNRVENLEWVTRRENTIHSFKTGLQKPKYGTDHHRFRFNSDEVMDIVFSRQRGEMIKDIAKRYKASRCTIRYCLKIYG